MLSQSEFEGKVNEVIRLHRRPAPGITIGVAMVDLALELLGPVSGKLNAVAETQTCLTDVIQVMTGCTVGNRYLKFHDTLGRYALTLFDRKSGLGVRVFVDIDKIDPGQTPELHRFFMRKRGPEIEAGGPAREASGQKIIEEFGRVGRTILGSERVQVVNLGKDPMLPAHVCTKCGESFLENGTPTCDVCSGKVAYYRRIDR